MPMIEGVKFERVGLKTSAGRLRQLAMEINEGWKRRMEDVRKEEVRGQMEVHPSRARWNEYAAIMERFDLGEDVGGQVKKVIEDIGSDSERGKYCDEIGFWFEFAREHPEIVAADKVAVIWKDAVLLGENPIYKLSDYCDYVGKTEDVEARLIEQMGDEVVAYLPTVRTMIATGGEGDSHTLESLLRMMGKLRQIGQPTEGYENYFNYLIVNLKPERTDSGVLVKLMDFMTIHCNDQTRLDARWHILRMTTTRIDRGDLDVTEGGRLLQHAAEDLASLNFYEEAEVLWKRSLPMMEFSYSDMSAELIGCALRTGNEAKLAPLAEHHLAVARQQHKEVWLGLEVEIARTWNVAWFLAVEHHLPEELQEKYLEAPTILNALRQGQYDCVIDDLVGLCRIYPGRTRLRKWTRERIRRSLNRINSRRRRVDEEDGLEAARILKAAAKFGSL